MTYAELGRVTNLGRSAVETMRYLGSGILLFGAVLMLVMRASQPAYFRGETLTMDTPPLP